MKKQKLGRVFWLLPALCLLTLPAGAEGAYTPPDEPAPCVHALEERPAVTQSCVTDGHDPYYVCTLCGTAFADAAATAPIDDLTKWSGWHGAPGHDWDEGTEITVPTCETAGEMLYTCLACGNTRKEPVPAKGHDWGEWSKTDEKVHQRVCAHDATHVEAQEHSWDEGAVTKEPTIVSKGVKTYTCPVCNGTKTEELPWLPLSTKTECRPLSEVPGGLAAIPELDTVEEITAALKTALQSKSRSDKMAFYDVCMLYSTDEGETWQEATGEFFPSSGKLTVIIPYPSGTNSVGYNFVAAHMFDTDEQGRTPGEIEYPTVVKTKSGLMLTMTGFSPVGISWTAAGVATGDGNDPVFWGTLTVLCGAALGSALCRGRKRGRRV
ncbi:MAG: hypothetical protein PUC52_07750 [bacterium]|nr:hypothetical protein [bacterium]